MPPESLVDRYLDVRQAALLEYDETLQKVAMAFREIGIARVDLSAVTAAAVRRLKENQLSAMQMQSWPTTLRLRALTARIADERLTAATSKVLEAGSQETAGLDLTLTYLTDQAHHRAGILLRELAEKDASEIQERPDQ
jgi:hypothetical protein